MLDIQIHQIANFTINAIVQKTAYQALFRTLTCSGAITRTAMNPQ